MKRLIYVVAVLMLASCTPTPPVTNVSCDKVDKYSTNRVYHYDNSGIGGYGR